MELQDNDDELPGTIFLWRFQRKLVKLQKNKQGKHPSEDKIRDEDDRNLPDLFKHYFIN